MTYKSPIEVITAELSHELDGAVVRACQAVHVNVDAEELVKALAYDRDQYRKGFADGSRNAQWIHVTERLPKEPEPVLIQRGRKMKPMRLVDIGNLTIKIQYPRCNGKTVVIEAIEKALNELPTVDAIPVDWLLQHGKTAYASDTVEYIREVEQYNKTIIDLIDKWRSEREEE